MIIALGTRLCRQIVSYLWCLPENTLDINGGGGFVVARRSLARSMPEEYAVNFRLRGRGAVNHLELKLVDATGQNVWRYVYKDLRFPLRWSAMRVDSRDIE